MSSNQQEVEKLSHEEHILKLPDTYIGSNEKTTENIWVFDEEQNKMVKRNITYVPGEYKIYDEILVNAVDQQIRLKEKSKNNPEIQLVKNIKVDICKEEGRITVFNDGDGIPIEIHTKEKIWIPELIFGHLLTSSNYSETKKIKHVGGKNGYGAKLTNIFSSEFTIETVCSYAKKKYIQTFQNNMSIKGKPKITTNKSKPYTKISFIPDHGRFGCKELEDDLILVLKKRVYDIAAFTDSSINVYLNGKKIDIKNFEKYVDLYIGGKDASKRAYEYVNDRWEVGAALNPYLNFEQVSMVNGINTLQGGKHVDYIINNICKRLAEYIKKKKKIDIKLSYIKENVILFLKCSIDNPAFNSQTKEYLTTNASNFGSKCELSNKFIETLAKSGILDKALELYEAKENKDMKKIDGKKNSKITGIPKLDDANWAGTKKSNQCTLILTEGDSAKAMAIAGLGVIGRDKYGVFPLRGKLLNVKDKSNGIKKKILENAEIKNLIRILGLQMDKKYVDTNSLRYGRVCILTDQDEDGSHIKGLVFNLFETLWPSLFSLRGFLTTILTPVIKATKGKLSVSFYCLSDYEKWKSKNNEGKGWGIKYYKGLGTSNSKEAKEYFKNFNLVTYLAEKEADIKSINLAFSQDENSADIRKEWLSGYDKSVTLDYNSKEVSIQDFINKDLIHFSSSDNNRSIPNVIDGLKKSQRKVLFSAFKRNLKKEIRVAQFAGYISEHASYHHGEASLQGTIVNMAQDYVGSNNINLLMPNGQFGTRLKGGKDAAQPRYIHTCLSEITNKIFNKVDEALLDYINDDGFIVEPEFYIPIIPMILVNGCQGIGTGWSTKIPCYNPVDIVENINNLIEGKPMKDLVPWYRGFTGEIIPHDNGYISKGKYKILGDKVIITELPIGSWTDTYKEFLETILVDTNNKTKKNPYIRSYKTYCTESEVEFELTFLREKLDKLRDDKSYPINKLESVLKLTSKLSTNNMVLHDREGKLQKFETPNDIIKYHFNIRNEYYVKRKEHLLNVYNKEISILEMKVRFINDFISKKIEISNKKKLEIIEQLKTLNYKTMKELDPSINESDDNGFDYLLRMQIYNLTKEKIDEFNETLNNNKSKYDKLESKTSYVLWKDDLKDTEFISKKKKLIIKKNK